MMRHGLFLPLRDLSQQLVRRDGNDWTDRRGNSPAGRVVLPARMLLVTERSAIGFGGKPDLVLWDGDAEGWFDPGDGKVYFTSAGRVFSFRCYDAARNPIGFYPLTEGSGTAIFSVDGAGGESGYLSDDIGWATTGERVSYANREGYYRNSDDAFVPMRTDRSAYADGSELTGPGRFSGRVAYPARFGHFPAAGFGTGPACHVESLAGIPALSGAGVCTITAMLRATSGVSNLLIGQCGNNAGIFLALYNGQALVEIRTGTSTYVYGSAVLSDPTSYHRYTLVWDGSQATNAAKLRLFIDGEAQSLTFGSSGGGTLGSTTPATGTTRFRVGYLLGGNTVNGEAFDVRVFDSALTQVQVRALQDSDADPVAPVLRWTFDEFAAVSGTSPAGFRVWDVTGKGNHGVATGATPVRRENGPLWSLTRGYQVYGTETASRCVPLRVDGFPQIPGNAAYTENGVTLDHISDHPPLPGGWNGNQRFELCRLNLFPGFKSVVPAEFTVVYDLVEDRNEPGFPFGDDRDVTVTFNELLALRDSAVAGLCRRIACRRWVRAGGIVAGVDRLCNYSASLTPRQWSRVLRHLRDRAC